jgi:hypothetical protein
MELKLLITSIVFSIAVIVGVCYIYQHIFGDME